jgi:hypothetical protein
MIPKSVQRFSDKIMRKPRNARQTASPACRARSGGLLWSISRKSGHRFSAGNATGVVRVTKSLTNHPAIFRQVKSGL